MPPPLVSANRTYLVIVDIFLYIYILYLSEPIKDAQDTVTNTHTHRHTDAIQYNTILSILYYIIYNNT